MRLEEIKKDIPETPEFIHNMIQNEVDRQIQDTKVVNMQTRRGKKWTSVRAAAIAAVCVLAVPTVAYAGVKLYHMYLEKQGTFSVATGIRADDSTGKMNLPEKIHDIDITAGYIPEGMMWIDESHLEYPEHGRTGGFSFASVLLDDDDLNKVMRDKNVVDSEERIFGNYEGVYLKYHDLAEDGSFNQRIYFFCPEVYRVIIVYIGDDIEKEDAVKVVENLAITENDTMIATAGMNTWSKEVSPEETSGEAEITSIADDKLPMHQIGEEFELSASGENSDGSYIENNKISVCVDAVRVEDNLQLLGQNHVPEEWMTAVGADGKIVNNTLSYIKFGDGVDTVDEIVKTESVKQKLVYVTVTYTNKSDEEINHMLYIGTLMRMNHEDRMYHIYYPTEPEQSGDDYDYVIGNGVARTAEMTYHSVSEDYGNGENYIPSLKPGESIQANMAWIVNENDLDKMYLDFNGAGGAYGFSDLMLKTGLLTFVSSENYIAETRLSILGSLF